MASINALNPIDESNITQQQDVRNNLEELVKKYYKGNFSVEISKFHQEEFVIVQDNIQTTCVNFHHKEVGVSTPSLPSWLVEVIEDIEASDHIQFDVYVNNE